MKLEERAGERRRVSIFFLGCLNQLLNLWRRIAVILDLPHHRHAPGSAMQGVPYFQQNTIAIFPPLMVPETQFLDSPGGEKLFPFHIMRSLLRQSVVKSIHLN